MNGEREFDCIEMKNRIQEELLREYEGLTAEQERRKRLHKLVTADSPAARIWQAAFWSLLIFVLQSASYADLAPPPEWLEEAQKSEPELASIPRAWMQQMPRPEHHIGESWRSYQRLYDEAFASLRASIKPEMAESIPRKLAAAYASQPPNWGVVALGLDAAYFAAPDTRSLDVAARIVQSPPPSKYAQILRSSMRLLGQSGQDKYIQILEHCLDDKYLGALDGYNERCVAGDAVAALTNMDTPSPKRRARLERLARKYPFDPAVDNANESTAKFIGYCVRGIMASIRVTESNALIERKGLAVP